jgi:bifunctional DNA-binding transcriptional regulator/antitoxin component of YhaV-PrlF toxin-antitoxin module
MTSSALRLGERGVLTLPKELRDQYDLGPGSDLTLTDLGGVFVLAPRRSEIDEVADRISRKLTGKGESLESMLSAVREEREHYGKRR